MTLYRFLQIQLELQALGDIWLAANDPLKRAAVEDIAFTLIAEREQHWLSRQLQLEKSKAALAAPISTSVEGDTNV